MIKFPLAWCVCLAALVVPLRAGAALPAPGGPVTDVARVLTGSDQPDLVALFREVERTTSAEIAVVTVPSLDGMSIEEYADRLFKEWGIGQRGRDNGVLILVAPRDRAIRIEVGYGLEEILPDGLAGEIIRDEALPAFRFRNYSGGIVATARRVAAIVEANQRLTPEQQARFARQNRRAVSVNDLLLVVPLFASSIFFGMFQLVRGVRMRERLDVLRGLGFAGVPIAASFALPDLGASPLIVLPLAAIGLVAGFFLARRPTRPASMPSEQARLDRRLANEAAWRKFNEERGYNAEPDPDNGSRRSRGETSEPTSWSRGSHGSGSSSSDRFGGGRSGGGGATGKW